MIPWFGGAGSDDPLILPIARKHGVTDSDLLHAFRNPVHVLGDNGQMLVGPASNGTLLEVGVDQVIDHPRRAGDLPRHAGQSEVPAPSKAKRRR